MTVNAFSCGSARDRLLRDFPARHDETRICREGELLEDRTHIRGAIGTGKDLRRKDRARGLHVFEEQRLRWNCSSSLKDKAVSLQPERCAVSARSAHHPDRPFFTGDHEPVLANDEIVTEILIPKQPAGSGTAFLKFLPASQDDYATISVAAQVALNGNGTVAEARVALGAAATGPVRARAVEAALSGRAADEKTFREAASQVLNAIDPIADFRGSAEYKRKMAVVHVRRALAEAAAKARCPV